MDLDGDDIRVGVSGSVGDSGGAVPGAGPVALITDDEGAGRTIAAVQPLLVAGTTLLVTDAPVLPDGRAPALTVVSNGAAPP